MLIPVKVFKSGNSDAIRLNKDVKKQLNIKTGDKLDLHVDAATGRVYLEPHVEGVSSEFKALFDQVEKEYAGSFEYLKDR